jgi:hypothetical protein
VLQSRPISTQRIVEITTKVRSELLPALTARVAREELAKVQTTQPAPYVQFVDGREGAALETVRPGGNILFKFNRLGGALDWIYEQLLIHSPVGPDRPPHLHYIQDHELYIDGERINVVIGEIADVPPGGTAMILDARPYAAKIERGLSTQAPDGVYEITAIAAQRRFPYARITFDYVSLGTVAATARAGTRHVLHPRNAAHAGYRYPSITVRAG